MMNFTLYKPLHGHDEDAPPFADGSMLIVCDGLGGSGANRHALPDGSEHTSAYLGSRLVIGAVQEYCAGNFDAFFESEESLKAHLDGLKTHLKARLDEYVAENQLTCIVRGKSQHMLPTTLAAILYRVREDQTADVMVISAGDSRAYVLNERDGLHQISRDDAPENTDAFSINTGMTNNVSQDLDFHLNYHQLNVELPCTLFVCSDGCFDYLDHPMRLEFIMEYALLQSITAGDGFADSMSRQLSDLLDQYGTKDDCTVAGAVLGCDNPVGLQHQYLERLDHVSQYYLERYETLKEAEAAEKKKTGEEIAALAQKLDRLSVSFRDILRIYLTTHLTRETEGHPDVNDPYRLVTGDALNAFHRFGEYKTRVGELVRRREQDRQTAEVCVREARQTIIRTHRENRYEDVSARVAGERRFLGLSGFGKTAPADPLYIGLCRERDSADSAIAAAKQSFNRTAESFGDMFAAYADSVRNNRNHTITADQLEAAFHGFLQARDSLNKTREDMSARFEAYRQSYFNAPATEEEFREACQALYDRIADEPAYDQLLRQFSRAVDERNSIAGISTKERLAVFTALYDEHPDEWVEHFRLFPGLPEHIWGDLPEQQRELAIRKAGLENTMQTAVNRARSVWDEYKVTYEWFRKGLGGQV